MLTCNVVSSVSGNKTVRRTNQLNGISSLHNNTKAILPALLKKPVCKSCFSSTAEKVKSN